MKNSNDTIGNQTHDLLACSAVPQPTATPRTPFNCVVCEVTESIYKNVAMTKCRESNDRLVTKSSSLLSLLKCNSEMAYGRTETDMA
jgi:hypothetical protein